MKSFLLILCLISLSGLALEPTVSHAEKRLLDKVACLAPEQAVAKLQDACTETSSAALDFALAVKLRDNRQPKQAQEALLKALRKTPAFHRARLLLVQLLAQSNQLQACIPHLTYLLSAPDSAPSHKLWALLAQSYADGDQLIPAEQAIRQAIALHASYEPYQLLLLNILFRQHSDQQAASLARQLLPKHPTRELLWLAILNPLLQEQRLEDANDLLTVARTYLPQNVRLMGIHADILLKMKLYAPATTLLQTLRQQGKLPAGQALAAARTLLYAQQEAVAMDLLNSLEGKQLSPALDLEYQKLSLMTTTSGKAQEQLQRWLKLLALDPTDSEIALHTARLHKQCNQISQAMELLERSAKLHPDNYEVLLELAELQMHEKLLAKAISTLQKAYAIFPNQPLLQTIERLRATKQ